MKTSSYLKIKSHTLSGYQRQLNVFNIKESVIENFALKMDVKMKLTITTKKYAVNPTKHFPTTAILRQIGFMNLVRQRESKAT